MAAACAKCLETRLPHNGLSLACGRCGGDPDRPVFNSCQNLPDTLYELLQQVGRKRRSLRLNPDYISKDGTYLEQKISELEEKLAISIEVNEILWFILHPDETAETSSHCMMPVVMSRSDWINEEEQVQLRIQDALMLAMEALSRTDHGNAKSDDDLCSEGRLLSSENQLTTEEERDLNRAFNDFCVARDFGAASVQMETSDYTPTVCSASHTEHAPCPATPSTDDVITRNIREQPMRQKFSTDAITRQRSRGISEGWSLSLLAEEETQNLKTSLQDGMGGYPTTEDGIFAEDGLFRILSQIKSSTDESPASPSESWGEDDPQDGRMPRGGMLDVSLSEHLASREQPGFHYPSSLKSLPQPLLFGGTVAGLYDPFPPDEMSVNAQIDDAMPKRTRRRGRRGGRKHGGGKNRHQRQALAVLTAMSGIRHSTNVLQGYNPNANKLPTSTLELSFQNCQISRRSSSATPR